MKKLIIIFLCLFSLVASAQKYAVDTKASSLTWTGHAQTGVYSPKGSLQVKSGTLTMTGGKLTAGTVIIDMSSLKTNNAQMQEHLRNDDFFDVKRFPEASLIITSVTGTTANGNLTIKGITLPIIFDLSVNKAAVHATATIDRTRYGIKYNSASYFQDLGSYAIKNTFEIEVDLAFI